MCVSLAVASLIVAVAGTAVATTATVESAQSQKDAENANNKVAEQKAVAAENAGAQSAADQQLKTKRLMASQVAAAGAGGVDPSTGTPLTLVGQSAEFGELDSLRIINNASRVAWGYTASPEDTSMTGGYMKAGATLLGGVSNAYFGAQKAGAFSSSAPTPQYTGMGSTSYNAPAFQW